MRHRLLQNSSESEENWSTSNSVQVRTGVLPVPPSGDRWNVNFFHFRRFTRFISSHFHSAPTQKNGKMRADWMMKQRTPKQSAYLCRWEFCFVCLRIYSFGISRPAATVLWHWPPSCSFQKNFPETAVAMETVPGQVKQGEEGGTGVRLPLDHFSTRWKWNSFFSIVVPFCPGFGTAKTQRLLRIKADLTKIAI